MSSAAHRKFINGAIKKEGSPFASSLFCLLSFAKLHVSLNVYHGSSDFFVDRNYFEALHPEREREKDRER